MLLYAGNLLAQSNVPYFRSYSKDDYHAGRQNWDVEIDEKGVVYFANSNGLLYNSFGKWELLQTPVEDDIIRSVLAVKDTVWIGGSQIGFFKKEQGVYTYTNVKNTASSQIWNSISTSTHIYFQSDYYLYVYDRSSKEIATYFNESGYWSLAEWNGRVWVVQRNGRLGVFEKGRVVDELEAPSLENKEVRQFFVFNNSLHIATFEGDLLQFDGTQVFDLALPEELSNSKFFAAAGYDNNSLLIGTIIDGVYRLGKNLEVLEHVNSEIGLIDDTILALAVDRLGNVWLGLDYGIAKIELQSPFHPLFDGAATYDIIEFEGSIFLATNKGLFKKNETGDFQLVKNSGGQIWNLDVIDDDLYVSHIMGLFKYTESGLQFIGDYGGFIDIEQMPGSNSVLFSTLHGFFHVKKIGEEFLYVENLELYSQPKLIVDEKNRSVWGETTEGTIIQFKHNSDGLIDVIDHPDIHKVFSTRFGTFFYDGAIKQFSNNELKTVNHPLLSEVHGDVQALTVNMEGSKIAFLSDDKLHLYVILPDGNMHSYSELFTALGDDLIEYNARLSINNEELLIATERGVISFELNHTSPFNSISRQEITAINVVGSTEGLSFHFPFPDDGLNFKNSERDLLFEFGTNGSHYNLIEYRYKLDGYDADWSDWNTATEALYPQISGGVYQFQLESRINAGNVQQSTVTIIIDKFWHETSWILIPIGLSVLVLIAGYTIVFNKITERKLSRQAQEHKLAEGKRTLDFKNEQLLQYVEIISHKNEFLRSLKTGLEKMRNNEAQRWVRKISDEVSHEKKEFLFHRLFSELHQDFIERITKEYPALTPNDIRLLTFFRVNLQSHEIANLMNISPRSLDTARYRLRKKLHLDHETDLYSFVREF